MGFFFFMSRGDKIHGLGTVRKGSHRVGGVGGRIVGDRIFTELDGVGGTAVQYGNEQRREYDEQAKNIHFLSILCKCGKIEILGGNQI
jgi:hypothetical protein